MLASRLTAPLDCCVERVGEMVVEADGLQRRVAELGARSHATTPAASSS